MKKGIKNLQASIRARLQNIARQTNRPFSEILQYYGMERFLYRISRSMYADDFILKGALMFCVWQVPGRRTTLDMDFSARHDNKVETAERIIKDMCGTAVTSDGLIFDPGTVKGRKIREDADYEGVRVKFLGFLERARIPMQIDMAFGDAIYPRPEKIDYPVILDFPRPRLKGYPIESSVSEKFESMVKLGLLNSRMKDYYDVWLMLRRFDFEGIKLAEALRRTFEHRGTILPRGKPIFAEEIYDIKSDRQMLWKAFLKKNEIRNAPGNLYAVASEIERFIKGPLGVIAKGEVFKKGWKAGGPWK